jgi:hypothetical protein
VEAQDKVERIIDKQIQMRQRNGDTSIGAKLKYLNQMKEEGYELDIAEEFKWKCDT